MQNVVLNSIVQLGVCGEGWCSARINTQAFVDYVTWNIVMWVQIRMSTGIIICWWSCADCREYGRVEKFKKWKEGMETKALQINVKIKIMAGEKWHDDGTVDV